MMRFRDVAVSAISLLVALPLMLVLSILIRIFLGSPVFFRQARPGLHGMLFTLVKFRTMREPAPGEDRLASDAERLTRLGAFLRRTSLDELPTLWNVLKGDMSLVGPRPLLPEYLSRYTPEQARRHEVKPGITGWAQVQGRNAVDWNERLRLDVWYVDHKGILLDMKILCMTLGVVLRGQGVSAAGHATMPEFLGARQSSADGGR